MLIISAKLRRVEERSGMYKVKRFFKKLLSPVSIMMIPHDGKRTINIKVPSIGIAGSVVLWLFGSLYIFSIAVDTIEYYNMKNSLNFYTVQFTELKDTITTIKKAENEFKKLLSLGSKKEILENVTPTSGDASKSGRVDDAGSLDMDTLKKQIENTVRSVGSIKEFLKEQKNIFLATPVGWPVTGKVTSVFGMRENPKHGGAEFHSGLDISAHTGTPVKATAEGIVSFSGWSQGNGNLVVIEHGFGYSTFYAHNSVTKASVGQKVKRGDVIAFVGATGNTTGPHLHYEVWHNGKATNPIAFVREVK